MRGEITAFLALIFVLIVSFIASIIESTSLQITKNYRRADMNRAVESVFAEYQRDLLEEFDVFALDGSYESGEFSEQRIFDRLSYYGASQTQQEITGIQFLTDDGGSSFVEQAAAYIESKYGFALLDDLVPDIQIFKRQEQSAADYQAQEQAAGSELDSLLEKSGQTLPEQDNPLPNIQNLRQGSLVGIVMPKGRAVSEKSMDVSSLVSNRRRRSGYGSFSDAAYEETATLAFGEYLLEHFSSAVPGHDEQTGGMGGLDYELEYILSGNSSDRENLEGVIKKLLPVRFVSNYGHVMSDSRKRAQAQSLALALCTAIALPAASQAAAQVLLLAWAFGESVVDIRSLLAGNKVPLIKTEESWQLQLSALLTLGTQDDKDSGKDTENGLAYLDYLRILLFLQDKETLALRALDMVEQKFWTEKGLAWFRADTCVSRMEFSSTCNLRRGITYKFKTYFGYR